MFGKWLQAARKLRQRSRREKRQRDLQGNRRASLLSGEFLEPRLVLSSSYVAMQRNTELQYWNPTLADNGYTLFGSRGTTYLLDMNGQVVHTWPVGTNPHLLSNGDVLDFMNGSSPSGATGLEEVDWSGNVVWSYPSARSTYHIHHDFERIFNPDLNEYTTIYIANKDYTYSQLVAAGANPNTTPSTGGQLDTITEVDSTGAIVWEWDFFDHVIQDYDSTKPNYVGAGNTVANYPGKLDIDMPGHPLKDDWLHCNSLDFSPSLDQIVINSVEGEFYVIDHKNTIVPGNAMASIALAASTAGDFLYRFGDPGRYLQGTTPSITGITATIADKQLGGDHDIQWIPAGLPGAGDFLDFNNGEYLSQTTSQSYVEEINPYLNASGVNTGHYVNPPDAGYNTITPAAVEDKSSMQISKQVVWDWSSQSNLTVESTIGGSAQRLPNGNTLICSDCYGYVTEVTPSNQVVWDYIVPISNTYGTVQTLGDRAPYDNSIFRAYRYDASYSAFSAHTLTAGATIAGRTSVANPYYNAATASTNCGYEGLDRATETQYWDPTDAYNGYTFFSSMGASYLIDMQGRVVDTWATGIDAQLLNTGDVLDWGTDSNGNITGLKEYNWSGNLVWQYTETDSTLHPHGAFERIYDPDLGQYTTLFLANKDETYAQLVAAGANPATTPATGGQMDTLVEVDSSGNVVWQWSFFDHLIQSLDSTKANYVGTGKTIASYPGKLNINLTGIPLANDWLDCNSVDFNPSLDQIVINSSQGEFYIIDHGNTIVAGNAAASIAKTATTAGDFLYRFGDPARYGAGTSPAVNSDWDSATTGSKQIGASSSVKWIPAGLPGAGDHVYGAQIPAQGNGTPVSYYITASDTTGLSTSDPTAALASAYSYTVGQATPTVQFNELMSNPTTLTATSDYPQATVGLITSSGVGNTTAGNAASGYTLIAPLLGDDTYLVNGQGQVVNTWVSSYNPGRSCYLLPNGNLIRSGSLPNSPVNTGGGEGGIIQEFAWNGSLIGQFTYTGTNTEGGTAGLGYVQHHDFLVMPNGDILMLVIQNYTQTQAVAAGFNPKLFDSSINSTGLIEIDGLVEVAPNWSTNSYTTVWQWSFWNHLVQNYLPSGQTFYTNSSGQTVYVSDYQSTITDPYLLNANCGKNTIQFFNHANGIDYNAALNQIILSARNQSEFYIIDRGTTSDQAATGTGGTQGHGGDFLYR